MSGKRLLVVCVCLMGELLAVRGESAPADTVQAQRVERLGWMAGCWAREGEKRIVEEQWMRPRGGTMHGMSRTVSKQDGRTVDFEATRIEELEGRLRFIAKPARQPEATFEAITLTDSSVVFENPAHDFPQRVGYRRLPGGGIEGWIEGREPGAAADAPVRSILFPYSAASCP